jgi:hypothetical protein
MMELLVRLAGQKYIESYKTTSNWFEAVKMLWDEHLENTMTTFDEQKCEFISVIRYLLNLLLKGVRSATGTRSVTTALRITGKSLNGCTKTTLKRRSSQVRRRLCAWKSSLI